MWTTFANELTNSKLLRMFCLEGWWYTKLQVSQTNELGWVQTNFTWKKKYQIEVHRFRIISNWDYSSQSFWNNKNIFNNFCEPITKFGRLNLMTISHSQMNLFTAEQILEKHLIAIPFKHVANTEHTKTHRYCTHINIQTYLCMKTVFMPKALAMAQACWPPAPPKHANTCSDVSCPLACWEKADIQNRNLDTHPVKQQLVG